MVDASAILGIVGGLVVAWALLLVMLWIARPRDVALREVVRLVPDVVRMVRSLIADATTPGSSRLALAVLLLWLISPIDLVPEFLPVIGPLDDVIVAILVLRFVRGRLGEDAFRRRWPGTDDGYRLLRRMLG